MITEKQKEILKLLIASQKGYNINQVAKNTKLSASWTHETLRALSKQGILTADKKGNSVVFNINWKDEKAHKLAELIALENPGEINIPKTNYEVSEKKSEVEAKTEGHQSASYAVNQPKQEFVEAKQDSFYSSAQPASNTNFAYSPQQGNFYNQSSQTSLYGVAPVGSEGVNTVLGNYAATGAFGYSNANSFSGGNQHYGSRGAVPPNTLGSRISSNVSRFTLKNHTTEHLSTVQGCNYCAPQPIVQ